MNQKLTASTKQKIRKLSLFNFKLWKNHSNFYVLKCIFKNKKYDDQKALQFLQEKNLITKYNMITDRGMSVILSHKLNLPILSIFILSKLYNYQTSIRQDMILPKLTLMKSFELFSTVDTVSRMIRTMKQKQFLDHLGDQQLRITTKKLDELKKYDYYLLQINQYVDVINRKIENLISNDSLVIQNREKNTKLLEDFTTNV